jgi:hypothetical protein
MHLLTREGLCLKTSHNLTFLLDSLKHLPTYTTCRITSICVFLCAHLHICDLLCQNESIFYVAGSCQYPETAGSCQYPETVSLRILTWTTNVEYWFILTQQFLHDSTIPKKSDQGPLVFTWAETVFLILNNQLPVTTNVVSSNPHRRGILYTLCDEVCQWLATGRQFSPVSSTNKTDRHGITETSPSFSHLANVEVNNACWLRTNSIASSTNVLCLAFMDCSNVMPSIKWVVLEMANYERVHSQLLSDQVCELRSISHPVLKVKTRV